MIDLRKDDTYLLACSFGPDSMALLNMLVEADMKPIVCHVNYHRRPESDWEQTGLEQYCLKHNLELNVLDTKGLNPKGNFQAWARNIRYRFFNDLYREYHADGLLVAHHEDDLIETYYLQKSRKTRVLFYGLPYKAEAFGMTVLRPLLSFSKANLLAYCRDHKVPFSVDSSNLTDHYKRNRIRHETVEKMTVEERLNVVADIKQENDKNEATVMHLKSLFSSFEQVSVSLAGQQTLDAFSFLLYSMLRAKNVYLPLSSDRIQQVYDLCHSQRPNAFVPIGLKWQFERQYDNLLLRMAEPSTTYAFVLSAPGPLTCPYFRVDFSQGYLKDYISQTHYPLTIRPLAEGDSIQVGEHTKRVNRLFIEWKLPVRLRKIWPIVVNKEGILVYVPRYQKDPRFLPQSNFVVNESFDYVQ